MKTRLRPYAARPHSQRGFVAVVLMMALLAIMVIYVATNARSLSQLKREIQLTEQKQIERLSKLRLQPAIRPATNAPPAAIPSAAPTQ